MFTKRIITSILLSVEDVDRDWILMIDSPEKSTAGGNLTDEFPVWTQKIPSL